MLDLNLIDIYKRVYRNKNLVEFLCYHCDEHSLYNLLKLYPDIILESETSSAIKALCSTRMLRGNRCKEQVAKLLLEFKDQYTIPLLLEACDLANTSENYAVSDVILTELGEKL
jgi:hypothetical protein